MKDITYDLNQIPFSTYGSYLAISYSVEEEKISGQSDKSLCIRCLHGKFHEQDHYALHLMDDAGNEITYASKGYVGKGTMIANDGNACFTFDSPDTLHLIGATTGLRITKTKIKQYDRVIPFSEKMIAVAGKDGTLMLTLKRGSMTFQAPWADNGQGSSSISIEIIPDESGQWEITLTLYVTTYHTREAIAFNDAVEHMESEFESFVKSFPLIPVDYEECALRALYVSWSCVMGIEGLVSAPIMPMSKNWMNYVWSWDHTFNGLAMVRGDPDLAWAQYIAMINRQGEDGAYPDCFNAYTEIRSFVKPPIHGFMIQRMLQLHMPDQQILEKVYQSLSKWTEWWLSQRTNETGIPMYCHGNDSGWDNGTIFAYGVPVCSPDCMAWLVVQMQTLSEIALLLGYRQQSMDWLGRSDQLLKLALEYFRQGDTLFAKLLPHETDIHSESLLQFVPLILSDKLPQEVREILLENLCMPQRYLTQYGFASEALDSPLFVEDGYWRGAIWPPLQYILAVALYENGRTEEAKQLAASFCSMCMKSGFAENYSAIDGRSLRDPAYTWSSSIYLMMIWDFLNP